MGLRINTNVASLTAQHKLQATSKRLGTTLERLSTGLRINKGSDDVVGLLKSESLRSQIRGISIAENNLTNASSALGVAEGTLAQVTELVQQMREKAVQGADATLSSSDRSNLTTALSDLLSEYTRLVKASEFDGVALLQGTFTAKTFQVGPKAGDTLSVTLSDTRSSSVGTVALLTSITMVATGVATATLNFTQAASDVTINSTAISLADDGVTPSNDDNDESALAYVNAINNISGTTGVLASALTNVVTSIAVTTSSALTTSQTVSINGVALTAKAYSADATGAESLAADINSISTQTGVTATRSGVFITLNATDGRNISVAVAGASAMALSNAASGGLMGFGSGIISVDLMSQQAGLKVGYRGTFRLTSDTAFTLANSSTTISSSTYTVSTSTTNVLNTVNVGSSTNAETALYILDNVLRQLQSRRSTIGSKVTRIEAARSELQSRQENLAASESAIRDTDIAGETANLTQFQILQQAGVQVLSRANQLPQLALVLLQQGG